LHETDDLLTPLVGIGLFGTSMVIRMPTSKLIKPIFVWVAATATALYQLFQKFLCSFAIA
jgi:TRAP-type C4-dicarboxylate transport system permease large subunit